MEIRLFGKSVLSIDKTEKRSQSTILRQLEELIFNNGGNKSNSGVVVNDESALKFSAVFACVRLISSSIAALPLPVYTTTPSGRILNKEHPNYKLLHDHVGAMAAMTFKQALLARALMQGNGYAKIHRDGTFRAVELELLNNVELMYNKQERKVYYRIDGKPQLYNDYDILHLKGMTLDGLTGLSVISYARETIGLGLANQEFGARFFGSGTNAGGFLEHPGNFGSDNEAYNRLQSTFNEKYKGLANSHGVIILEDGMKFNKIGIPPEDAQFLQSRQFQIADIARYFAVQPQKIGDLERSTNNNIEQQSIEFVQDTLLPWIVNFEQEINYKLFRMDEQGQHFAKFNVNGLLRGDAAARGELYSKMFNIGAMQLNEIRAREELNSIENGDTSFVQVNVQTLENAIKNTNINTN